MNKESFEDVVVPQHISRIFHTLPEHEPSRLGLNKIMAYAREKAAVRSRSFWFPFLRPSLAAFVIVTVSFFSYRVWQHNGHPENTKVALSQATPQNLGDVAKNIQDRLLDTPFDQSQTWVAPRYHYKTPSYQLRPGLNISTVSVGGNGDSFFNNEVDERLERHMLNKSLDSHELETLYFRARKLEKLGYFAEAIKDFQFIVTYYPNFPNQTAIQLAMARCYESTDQKASAITIIEEVMRDNGRHEDLIIWLDRLKSETL
jgi:tetratricopeptide (TPR) repeat protein